MMNFFIGLIIGIVLISIIFNNFGYGLTMHQAIEKCEASLPRTEHCIITAIPESKQNEQTN